MAHQEFVGTTYTVVHGTYTLEGVTSVKISQVGGPEPEQLPATGSGDTVYTYFPDPLGAKGQAKTTLTVLCHASLNAFVDNKATKIPLNTAASTVVAWQPATSNANEFTHTTLQLIKRVTKIPFDALATTELTFSANGAGTWDSPA